MKIRSILQDNTLDTIKSCIRVVNLCETLPEAIKMLKSYYEKLKKIYEDES